MNQPDIAAVIELINHRRLHEALALCQTALEADGQDHGALFLAGHIYGLTFDFDSALRYYQAALGLAENIPYFTGTTDALRKLGRLDEALATLGRCLALHPRDPQVRDTLESLLCEAGLRDEILALPPPAASPRGIAPTVTFETKVWEADWKVITQSGRLEDMIGYCDYPFAERVLVINNVEDRAAVIRQADHLVASGVLTGYLNVPDREAAALGYFNLTRDALGKGYVYSISELVGAHAVSTDYLLHFAGDSMMAAKQDWITPAIEVMEAQPRFAVANPVWGPDPLQQQGARQESFAEYGAFFAGFGFSDQCYLMRAADVRSDIYRFVHSAGRRYPAYGGELFEKRVDAWMRTTRRLRLTHKGSAYIHKNIR